MMKYAGIVTGLAWFLTLSSSHSIQAAQEIHRAIEPASISLDVALLKQRLTIFLTIPGQAIQYLAPDAASNDELIRPLLIQNGLMVTSPNAHCRLFSQRFFNTSSQSSSSRSKGIQGFVDFQCLNPAALATIKLELPKVFPGMKAANVWLTTDTWQEKQTITEPEFTIQLPN